MRTTEAAEFAFRRTAGDFAKLNTEVNEETDMIANLRRHYDSGVRFLCFLRGLFDDTYLGCEGSSSNYVFWEHRIDDPATFGV